MPQDSRKWNFMSAPTDIWSLSCSLFNILSVETCSILLVPFRREHPSTRKNEGGWGTREKDFVFNKEFEKN